MRLRVIRDGLAENRAGDLFELDGEVWRQLPDDVADRVAFNLMIDSLPGPLGDYMRMMRALVVMQLFLRHGAKLVERANAPLAAALRLITDAPRDA